MYLLDTNIISEMRRPNRADAGVKAFLETISATELHTSVISLMELERGVLRMERRDGAQGAVLRAWLAHTVTPAFAQRILTIDQDTAALCATLHVPDQAPENDAWIAALALQHRLTLVTRNTSDFERTGAKLLNPFSA